MIYKINKPHDTVGILEDAEIRDVIIFDVALDVDLSKIASAFKECEDCDTEHISGLDDSDAEYCDTGDCEGWLASTYADLVIQGDKVVYRRPR